MNANADAVPVHTGLPGGRRGGLTAAPASARKNHVITKR